MTDRKEKTVLSNRLVRHGYANELFRVVLVHINANENDAGEPLHEVHALRVRDGQDMTWWARDADLPRVTDKR